MSPPTRIGFGVFAPQGWKRELRGIADPQAKWAKTKEVTLAAEAGPAVEEAGEAGDHGGDRLPAGVALEPERRLQGVAGVGRRRREHGLGEAAGRERDGLVGHGGHYLAARGRGLPP